MSELYGYDSYIKYKIESAWGVFEAGDVTIPFKKLEAKPTLELIPRASEMNSSRFAVTPIAGGKYSTFSAGHNFYPDKCGTLLKAFFGSADVTSPAGPGTFDNLFVAGLSVDQSLSVEAGIGGGNTMEVAGIMLNTLKLSNDVKGEGAILQIEIGGGGKFGVEGSATIPDAQIVSPMVFHHATLTYAGASICVDNLSLELTNGLIIPNHKIGCGSQDTKQPILGSRFEGKGSFTVNFEDWSYFDKYRNITGAEIVATYTTTENITGAVPYVLTITLPVVIIDNPVPAVGSPELLKQNISFNLHSGTVGADETPVAVVLRCGTSYA